MELLSEILKLVSEADNIYKKVISGNKNVEEELSLVVDKMVNCADRLEELNLDDKDFADGEKTAYLCAFRVKEEYRGQGLGSSLMNAALSKLKESGFQTATIGVGSDKPQNIQLYRRLGFNTKVKDCHFDPCGMDENNQPEYEEEAWWLLSKNL